MRVASRWEQWRGDTPTDMLRSAARDLDDHDRALAEMDKRFAHIEEKIDGLSRTLTGFIISAAGLTIAAAINIVVLILRG